MGVLFELLQPGEVPVRANESATCRSTPIGNFAIPQMTDASLDLEVGEVLELGEVSLDAFLQTLEDHVGLVEILALKVNLEVAIRTTAGPRPEEAVGHQVGDELLR